MLTIAQQVKILLMAEGMCVTEDARRVLSGDDGRYPLTLADYASTSGIAMELEDNIWVNAPIHEFNPNFVASPPHCLDYQEGSFVVRSDGMQVRARPVPVPAYFNKKDSRGDPYVSYGITHTDRVRISPIEGCAFVCKFCDMPFKYDYRKKPLEGLIEVVQTALKDALLPAKHVLISGGTPRREDYSYLIGVYEAVLAAFPDLAVDIMMVPLPGLLEPEDLRNMGARGLSINMELFNEQVSRELMRHKNHIGRETTLQLIEDAVAAFGLGKIRSLLLVGLEPLEDTLRGVESLAQRGCDPVLSPFRPDPATPLRDRCPPGAASLREAYERSVEIVERCGVKLSPRCIPCQHNTLTFPDDSGCYFKHGQRDM